MTPNWHAFSFGMPWLLALVPLTAVVLWLLGRQGRVSGLIVSSVDLVRVVGRPVRTSAGWRRDWIRWLVVLLLLLALAQPRLERGVTPETAKAIDIILLVDASRSMDTKDFESGSQKISRLEALRNVVADFVKARPQDRIGVVGFAEKPYLLCPLTLDHSWMLDSLANIQTSLGTAIGSSVEAGVDLLRAGGNQSRVLILITDGLNTSGSDPLQAAKIAASAGVRLYTVAAVSYEGVATDHFDDNPLYQMAKTTGGRFFQGGTADTLHSIYAEIDRLERQKLLQVKGRQYRPLYVALVFGAIFLLGVETLLGASRWLRVP